MIMKNMRKRRNYHLNFGFKWLILLIICSLVFFNCGNDAQYQLHVFGLTENHVLESDTVVFSFIVSPEDWKEKGISVQFILDQEQYLTFEKDTLVSFSGLTPGAHAVIGLICNSNGITNKDENALVIRNFYYKQKTQPLLQNDKPLLVVCQPDKKIFRGQEADQILFDFRVINAELGSGYRLHYNLDGQDVYLDEEKHVWIENARKPGNHQLRVTLETEAGSPVLDNPFNDITLTFRVVEK